MPAVHIEMLRGRTQDQKRKMVESITRSIVESLGVRPEQVTIKIFEIETNQIAKAGVLRCDEAAAVRSG